VGRWTGFGDTRAFRPKFPYQRFRNDHAMALPMSSSRPAPGCCLHLAPLRWATVSRPTVQDPMQSLISHVP
jgi:hypothetical protein